MNPRLGHVSINTSREKETCKAEAVMLAVPYGGGDNEIVCEKRVTVGMESAEATSKPSREPRANVNASAIWAKEKSRKSIGCEGRTTSRIAVRANAANSLRNNFVISN